MPSFRRSARRDESPLTDESLAALLSGALPPDDVPPDLRAAADVLAALRAGPGRDELADEASALAEFRIRGPRLRGTRLGPASQPGRRSPGRRPLWSGKIAATAVVAVAVGGLAASAFIGVLPASLQRAVHDVIPVVRIRGGGKGGATSHGRAGHVGGAAAHCAGPGHTQSDGSLARPGEPATGRCARHRPTTREPVKPPRHVGCTPLPWASWSAHPRPSWTPSAWPTAWPTPSAGPTRWPTWDMPRCGQHWRWHWLRWHRHHLHWPGWPHSPAPSPTGTTKYHHAPQPGHNPTPQPNPQPTARHTGWPAPGHTSQPTRHHSPVHT